ncbi:MAG: hypothetical protein NTV34_08660 [Proteobacteria bacterium]|nr:hypothetical protein [Pseudomonadota bacterium]
MKSILQSIGQGFVRFSIVSSMFLIAPAIFADGDSSARVHGGFVNAVKNANGVILRVEINADGQENRDSATIRVHTGDTKVTSADDIQAAFAKGVNGSSEKQVTSSDLAKDSNTCGWWHYQYSGWAQPYYYSSYTPVYYNYGVTYNFYNPSYYSVWSYPVSYRYYYWN